jgi:hypothetical protein
MLEEDSTGPYDLATTITDSPAPCPVMHDSILTRPSLSFRCATPPRPIIVGAVNVHNSTSCLHCQAASPKIIPKMERDAKRAAIIRSIDLDFFTKATECVYHECNDNDLNKVMEQRTLLSATMTGVKIQFSPAASPSD